MKKTGSWNIGDVVRQLREGQGIKLEELSEGICAAATLSRIELGEREMGMMLAQRVFERLGYQCNQYEVYCSKKEFEQYEKREEIIRLKKQKNYQQMEKLLRAYEDTVKIENDNLQKQFLKSMWGALKACQGETEEGIVLLEEALSLTVLEWKERQIINRVLGFGELEILSVLADAYEMSNEYEKAYQVRKSILFYLEQKRVRKEQMAELYTDVICKMIPHLLNKKKVQTCLELCENALDVLADTARLYHWDSLLYWKGKSLEMLYWAEHAEKNQVIEAYKRAYYISRLLGSQHKAEEIRRYLKEKYEWEFTR